ncbi:MAG: PHP domain-containing protein [Candidatus Omnitrophica bacterium]|nr:PHP domain-containing protein [Candidatus Omnitrophota bacterium]
MEISNEVKFADLHLHTAFSDGSYAPEGLVSEAKRVGLSAIAIVDHDTVEGIGPALEIAKAGELEVLSGIELTAEYNNSEVHMLGYLIDYKNQELLHKLDTLKQNRVERIYRIVEKLKNEMDVSLDPESVFAIAGEGTVGRLHVARAMVKEGIIGSLFEAFQKYIGDRCPAYVAGFKLSPSEAIELIKKMGGIPVLAHPYTIGDEQVILKFIEYGLMGLEVYYPEHSQGMINYYLNIVKKHSLLATGGSDCHGAAKPQIKIGSTKIPYELVERLKIAKDKLG